MPIHAFGVENLRILQRSWIEASDGIHWFFGPNGSGKTSLIEAIHLLATGKTFSGKSELDPLIRDGAPHLTLRLELAEYPCVQLIKQRKQEKRLTMGMEGIRHHQLARHLPLVSLHGQALALVNGPALHRRRFLDWGPFHHQPGHAQALQAYQRLLRQRNTSLRRGDSDPVVKSWDKGLAEMAERINRQRGDYLEVLRPHLDLQLKKLLPRHRLELRFTPGWPRQRPLEEVLAEQLPQDCLRGHTQAGAHRADLRLFIDGHPARERLSQGEKRRLVAAMRLAQLSWIRDHASQTPVCLVDDFGSELDCEGGEILLKTLDELGVQSFITSIEGILENYHRCVPPATLFHVKQGQVTPLSTRDSVFPEVKS